MPDLNLALIDVAAAWVVVALPGFLQARLLRRSTWLSPDEKHIAGIDERESIDPTKHTALAGTLIAPAITSLAGIPVVAWGKRWDLPSSAKPAPGLGLQLALSALAAYAAQAIVFALLLLPLSYFYLAGAPVAARAGQLCLRLALLSVLLIPLLDAGVFWRTVGIPARMRGVFEWGAGLLALAGLAFTPALSHIDRFSLLGFFHLSQWMRAFLGVFA